MNVPILVYHCWTNLTQHRFIHSIISLMAWEISEISGISGLRGDVAPQKPSYFKHGRHLSHFEATVLSKWLL